MSDEIKHECGLAFIRLRKPFSFYLQKYGTALYGLNKLYLLMEKQHNRGQDGAGVASVKLNIEPGHPFLHRIRSNNNQPIADIFSKINEEVKDLEKYQPDIIKHPGLLKGHISLMGELLLGHLRYGTQGKNNVEFCHPFIKRDTIPARNLALAGNFNLVNTDELFALINIEPGEFQKQSDLAAMMEVIHHFIVQADEESQEDLNLVKGSYKEPCHFLMADLRWADWLAMAMDLYSGMPMASGRLIIMQMMKSLSQLPKVPPSEPYLMWGKMKYWNSCREMP